MSDFQIGQIFENEYPTKAATFANTNNCTIQTFEKIERTVDRIESRPGVRTGTYVIFTDGTEKSIVPCEIKIYVKGTKHMMPRLKIVEIPAPSIEELKTSKLTQLDAAFLKWYETDAVVTSSLGFVADSDSRAMMDVNGLVTTLEAQPAETRSTVAFMDANNEVHLLTLESLKQVQIEIIQNGQSAYQQKWALRTAIENAQTKEELEAIEIVFTPEDFSK